METLPTDSRDYHVLYNAAAAIKDVQGIVCEIGTRQGGSLSHIINGLLSAGDINRNVVCIDPYGDIDYAPREGELRKCGYSNHMRDEALPGIYNFAQGKPVNVVFFCLEDTEFFSRFADGVPVYQDYKQIINQYSLVFFDGPHDMASLFRELRFFYPRSVIGTIFIFDDIADYPHELIHEDLIKNNFEVIEYGVEGRKVSYKKVK
jgi:cephalosporin hydroxylase